MFKDMQYLDANLVELHYEMPINEIIYDFLTRSRRVLAAMLRSTMNSLTTVRATWSRWICCSTAIR